jgi:hypothetical protein
MLQITEHFALRRHLCSEARDSSLDLDCWGLDGIRLTMGSIIVFFIILSVYLSPKVKTYVEIYEIEIIILTFLSGACPRQNTALPFFIFHCHDPHQELAKCWFIYTRDYRVLWECYPTGTPSFPICILGGASRPVPRPPEPYRDYKAKARVLQARKILRNDSKARLQIHLERYDTYCINKESSAGLSYSHKEDLRAEISEFRKSRWFTSGWTLQELVSPSRVIFFDKNWERGRMSSQISLEFLLQCFSTGTPNRDAACTMNVLGSEEANDEGRGYCISLYGNFWCQYASILRWNEGWRGYAIFYL